MRVCPVPAAFAREHAAAVNLSTREGPPPFTPARGSSHEHTSPLSHLARSHLHEARCTRRAGSIHSPSNSLGSNHTSPVHTSPVHISTRLASQIPPLVRSYRLNASQWASVRSSLSYQTDPQWRLAQLGAEARTLRSSYRTGYARFSEFVPVDHIDGGEAVAAAVDAAAAARGQRASSQAVAAVAAAAAAAAATTTVTAVAATTAAATVVNVERSAADSARADVTALPIPAELSTTSPAGPKAHQPQASAAPRFYTERECARLMGFPEAYRLTGGKLYAQLGNAVCPQIVHAVARAMLVAMGRLTGGGAVAPGVADSGDGDVEGNGERICESFLTAGSVNVLRSVVAPHEHAEVERRARCLWPSSYASYRSETLDERLATVINRPVDALFCRECHATYRLDACEPCAEGAGGAAAGDGATDGVAMAVEAETLRTAWLRQRHIRLGDALATPPHASTGGGARVAAADLQPASADSERVRALRAAFASVVAGPHPLDCDSLDLALFAVG